MEMELEIVRIQAEIKAINREIELLNSQMNTAADLLTVRIKRLEDALGAEPSLIIKLENTHQHVKDLQSKIEVLKDEVKIKDAMVDSRDRTLVIGWRVTWAVIATGAGILAWVIANYAKIF